MSSSQAVVIRSNVRYLNQRIKDSRDSTIYYCQQVKLALDRNDIHAASIAQGLIEIYTQRFLRYILDRDIHVRHLDTLGRV